MLELETLRTLDLEAPSAPGRPAHLAAASGLRRSQDYIYVVGDDELNLAVYAMSDPGPGKLVRLFEGEMSSDEDVQQKQKPDLEAITLLPPFTRNPHGALLALGSGTGETRESGFVWSLGPDGELYGFPRLVDLSPLYDFQQQHVADMNIEGVAITGDRVVLVNRGNSKEGENVAIYLSLEEMTEALLSDFKLDASELLEVQSYDLGEKDGIPLAFSDVDALPDGRLVFTATAEGIPGTDHEDEDAGSAIGVIDQNGEVAYFEMIGDSDIALEGVDARISDEDDSIDVLLCQDADDPDIASPLYRATIPISGDLEAGTGRIQE